MRRSRRPVSVRHRHQSVTPFPEAYNGRCDLGVVIGHATSDDFPTVWTPVTDLLEPDHSTRHSHRSGGTACGGCSLQTPRRTLHVLRHRPTDDRLDPCRRAPSHRTDPKRSSQAVGHRSTATPSSCSNRTVESGTDTVSADSERQILTAQPAWTPKSNFLRCCRRRRPGSDGAATRSTVRRRGVVVCGRW